MVPMLPFAPTMANARNVSTSLLPYGGITYFINSFDYPNLLCFNSPPTQQQFPTDSLNRLIECNLASTKGLILLEVTLKALALTACQATRPWTVFNWYV